MTWGEAIERSRDVILVYIGISIVGLIIIGIGFAIMGSATASGGFGLGAIFGFLVIVAGYIWILVVGIALIIKLIADVTDEVVSDNLRRNNNLMKSLIQESSPPTG